jgi:hypothetical protein
MSRGGLPDASWRGTGAHQRPVPYDILRRRTAFDVEGYSKEMKIPTEPIGSIPRPASLIEAAGRVSADDPELEPLYDAAIRDTIARFEATGSPVITDGEQSKYHNVALQNAQSILLARRRAEEEPVQAKQALERRTEQLAHSLAIMRARRYLAVPVISRSGDVISDIGMPDADTGI